MWVCLFLLSVLLVLLHIFCNSVVWSTFAWWVDSFTIMNCPFLLMVIIFALTTTSLDSNSLHSYFFFFFLINLFIYSFIYFWLRWVFVAVLRLSLVAASGGYSSLQCAGFSLQWLLLLQSTGSRHTGFSSCSSQALECRLSSCGARA